MKHLATVGLSAFAAGYAASHWLDPEAGRRRRARAADQARGALRRAREDVEKSVRDLSNRTRGLAYEALARLRAGEPEDRVLEARSLSELGLLCSHPRAISIRAEGGRIVVEGAVLAAEADGVVRGLGRVRGVREVVDRLERHERADVPALQGGRPRPRAGLRGRDWKPAARLAVAASGVAAAAVALRRRSAFASAAALGALTAFAREPRGAAASSAPAPAGSVPAAGDGTDEARLTLSPA